MKYLTDLLERHRSYLKRKSAPTMNSSSSSGKRRSVLKAFEDNLTLVQLSEDEFHVQLDSAFRPTRTQQQRSAFSTSVIDSVTNIFSILRHSADYAFVFLTDEMMGIDKFAKDNSDSFMSPASRAKYRQKFRDELAYGNGHMTIHVFGKVNSGSDTDSLFVWKVPTINRNSPQHVGLVAKTIDECRKSLPKEVSKEAVRQFNSVINGLTSLPAKARDALRNIIYLGDPNPDKSLADEYVDFVMNVCAGEPIDESMLVDGRASNSRGGRGVHATKFDEFWTACKEVLMPDAQVEERRHSGVMYSSEAHSIPDLIAKATAVLQKKIVDGKLPVMPPIPCKEWVACQFVPNCAQRDAASKFTGRLDVKRAVQLRTLRKQHIDEHWVRALIRYFKEWMVELKHHKKFDGIEYWGQDDKAKIPIGEQVSFHANIHFRASPLPSSLTIYNSFQVHVSTGTRANNRGMVSATNGNHLKAGDHDYVVGRVIPHVSLRTNIPPDMSGSFFVGDEETGFGQIYVTLTDAVFDPSEIFDHCAQLIDALKDKKLKPTVLVLQTDGGPDHSLRRVAVKLALVALFLELSLDRLIVLRCAPNGSAGNPIERSMSVLNLPLAHTALRRADMPPYAEDAMKNVNSMSALRQVASKMDEKQKQATKEKAILEQHLNAALACKKLQSFISQHEIDLTTDQVNDVISSIYSFVGVKLRRNHDVTGAMETEDGGVQVERSETVHVDLLLHRLAQVDEEASRNFQLEWSKSVQEPIDVIAEKFAQLETSGRKVVVRPRVTADKVEALHSQLAKIDPNYSRAIMTKEHLSKVPLINQFIASHAVVTPYHIDLVKCNNHACCGELKTPLEVQDLALQRQPTPINDPQRPGHFYCRNDALKVFKGDTAAFTNLSDLPSQNVEKATTMAERKKRDTAITKELGKNIWAANRVRCIVVCFHCAKRRCVYSPDDRGYRRVAAALKQKLESVSERFSCGDLLFDDSDPLSKVLVQKMNLTCESDIENGYYNNKSRALKLQDICVHCGETEDVGSAGTFLLGQHQLEERCLTGGYSCRPICVECLEMKRKVVTYGKKDESNARAEKRRARSALTS